MSAPSVQRAYRRNLIAVTTASFIGFTGFTLVMPFLPLYFHQLGVTDVGEVATWSGLSLGVTPALTALLAPFWGRLADRFGRKIMVERSLASFVVVMGATAFVTSAWHVFALRAIQGLFAGYGPLTLTMAADSAPPEQTAQAIGVVQTAQRLGPALGPVIGGIVAELVGLRDAFLVAAAFYFLAVAVVFVLYDEGAVVEIHPAGGNGGNGAAVTFRNFLAFENFVVLMAVIFGLQFVDRSFGPILPLYVGALGIRAARVPLLSGILFSIAAAAGALGHHFCASLMRVWSASTIIAASAALAAAGAGAYVFAGHIGWLFVATPFFGLAIGTGTTAAYTSASAVMPPAARGAGFGLLTTASLIGLAVSPIVAGVLGATSLRAVFLLDAATLVGLAVLVRRVMVQTAR